MRKPSVHVDTAGINSIINAYMSAGIVQLQTQLPEYNKIQDAALILVQHMTHKQLPAFRQPEEAPVAIPVEHRVIPREALLQEIRE